MKNKFKYCLVNIFSIIPDLGNFGKLPYTRKFDHNIKSLRFKDMDDFMYYTYC